MAEAKEMAGHTSNLDRLMGIEGNNEMDRTIVKDSSITRIEAKTLNLCVESILLMIRED